MASSSEDTGFVSAMNTLFRSVYSAFASSRTVIQPSILSEDPVDGPDRAGQILFGNADDEIHSPVAAAVDAHGDLFVRQRFEDRGSERGIFGQLPADRGEEREILSGHAPSSIARRTSSSLPASSASDRMMSRLSIPAGV